MNNMTISRSLNDFDALPKGNTASDFFGLWFWISVIPDRIVVQLAINQQG
jgi:hypothetical protein